MKTTVRLLFFALLLTMCAAPVRADSLEAGFADPPEATKPWCYWYWISDNISRQGITQDLEAMARVGIGEALIGNIFLDDIPAGETKVLSDAWWALVEHAIREGARTGVNIGLFNCPGWSQSGGPWVQPEQAMRFLLSSETRVTGPQRLEQVLPIPREPFQDVALLAFPAAREKRLTLPPGADVVFTGKHTVSLNSATPFTARSLSLVPGKQPWKAQCTLQAEQNGRFATVRTFTFDRSNMAVGVGPMPRGPVTIAFEPVTATRFRLVFDKVQRKATLSEATLSSGTRLESYVEKQLGKMHPTPLPMWDTYRWPNSTEPEAPGLRIPPDGIRNLSGNMDATGRLRWDVPEGDWILLRVGMTPTGTRNSPASVEGQGWEVDKMNRDLAGMHFDAFIGKVLERLPAAERTAFKRVVADSYEQGSQNWTDGFENTFRKRYGYDPRPWFPVLTGRIVASAEQSDRFLWDLRRLVADHVARDYVGGLRDQCRPHGLELWLENYGHWGFPGEFLMYGGASDRIAGEYWVTGSLGSIECRAASSAANTYGKPVVSAEAFTGGPQFRTMPTDLKARGDWSFCEGINHLVLHVYIQQPWEDRKPGMNAWFGTEFNRHNTWFEDGRNWIDYIRRCSFLLQQGWRVADVAYFIGEDTPVMTGTCQPPLPAGRDFDYINAEVILRDVTVEDGLLTLPHGTRYRVLVLPDSATMRPAVARKIRDLVQAGATVLGSPPNRSPSMEDYPDCDNEVQQIADTLWRLGKTGKGTVFEGKPLEDVFAAVDLPPDFACSTPLLHTHREQDGKHVYFVSNQDDRDQVVQTAYRVSGMQPEHWDPVTGDRRDIAAYREEDGRTIVPLHLAPYGSAFIVFRRRVQGAAVVSVSREETTILSTKLTTTTITAAPPDDASTAGTFTIAVWAKPTADTTLHQETNKGVQGLGEPRNDAIAAPHGEAAFGSTDHAGSGLAIGRNGICVFEHSASYFVPILAHPAPIHDWTHVTVVYADNRPTLYLNGKPARQGLQSRYVVHSGVGVDRGVNKQDFQGRLGKVRVIGKGIDENAVSTLMAEMPRPGDRPVGSVINLAKTAADAFTARVREPGTYSVSFARGAPCTVHVAALPAPFSLGPWDVTFGGKPVRFEQLVSWTTHPEEAIRHHSGSASYTTTFSVPPGYRGRPVWLELGEVRDMAVIRINGQPVTTLWTAPWETDVSRYLKPGKNRLEVRVINAWNNRLVGDTKLPVEKRSTWLSAPRIKAGSPLLAAGLLGPAQLRAGAEAVIRPGNSRGH